MLKDKNHIDHLFSQGLKDFSEVPDSIIWDRINQELVVERRKKRTFLVLSMAASVALLLSFAAGYLLSDTKKIEDERLLGDQTVVRDGNENVAIQHQSSKEVQFVEAIKGNDRVPGSKVIVVGEAPIVPNGSTALLAKETTETNISRWLPEVREANQFALVQKNKEAVPTLSLTKLEDRGEPFGNSLSVEDRIVQYNQEMLAIKSQNEKRKLNWSLKGQVSSSYTSHFEGGNSDYPEAASFGSSYEEDKDGVWSVGGGIKINVQTGKRLSVQTGLCYNRIGQTTAQSGAMAMSFDSRSSFFVSPQQAGALRTSAGYIKVKDGGYLNAAGDRVTRVNSFQGTGPVALSSVLSQYFETLEIPLLLRYNIVDRRLAVHVLGGVSSNFIVGNNVYLNDGQSKQRIGETSDIRTTNFSTDLGLGFEYGITSRIRLSIEPSFKYYLNSISTNSEFDYRPYSLGVNTGVSFVF